MRVLPVQANALQLRHRTSFALPFWVALCCYFRHSRSHGYAAVVAAFTAVVITLGTFNSASKGSDAALIRIQVRVTLLC
jgi:hypothetical protein